jgi:hypothetical protein
VPSGNLALLENYSKENQILLRRKIASIFGDKAGDVKMLH